ncbi:glycosyltransferase [Candidatus Woesearchaeota archaeon]|nr:glycosyltransferase [Candidatus Woesearchaeota archaeon]
MKKRILLIVDEFFPIASAQAIRIHSFAKELSQKYTLDILCGEEKRNDEDRIEGVNYITVRRPKESEIKKFLYYLIKFNGVISKQTKKEKYDLVIITIPRYEFLYAISKFKTNQVPYILDIRDLLVTKNYELILKRIIPKSLAKTIAAQFEKRKRKAVRKVIENSLCTTVAYPGLYTYYTQEVPLEKEKIKLIPNGVDLSYFPKEDKDFSKDKLKILYIGNFHEKDLLPEIIEELSKNRKKEKLELIFVGEGRQKQEVERLIKEKSLEKQTHFLGKITHSEMYKIGKEADIGIILRDRNIPTLLPVSQVEYMAMGLPVIVNDYSELGDFVRETNSGYIINNLNELNNLLYQLLTKKEEFQSIGKKNREWIEKHGDRRKIAKEFEEKIVSKYI